MAKKNIYLEIVSMKMSKRKFLPLKMRNLLEKWNLHCLETEVTHIFRRYSLVVPPILKVSCSSSSFFHLKVSKRNLNTGIYLILLLLMNVCERDAYIEPWFYKVSSSHSSRAYSFINFFQHVGKLKIFNFFRNNCYDIIGQTFACHVYWINVQLFKKWCNFEYFNDRKLWTSNIF